MRKLIARTTSSIPELAFTYGVVLVLSAVVYGFAEHKQLGDAIWWAGVTATTVGYGDQYPTTMAGRVVAFGLMHLVPFVIIPLLTARLASTLIVNNDAFTHEEQEQLKSDLKRVRELLEEREGAVAIGFTAPIPREEAEDDE